MNAGRQAGESRTLAIVVALATLFALVLRAWGVTHQVVLDDEWHALHKLMTSSYHEIARSFGLADHSIPLTLLYKAMADTIGLAEGRLRILQITSGTALVPLGAWLAWRALRDAPAAALFAFLLAGAPFLVMWSRFARPYAVMVLLTMACIGALWHWRSQRTRSAVAWVAATAALSAWFHPLSAIYPALAWLFVFCEDVAAPGRVTPRPSLASARLAIRMGIAALVLLGWPLVHDFHSLREKAGGEYPDTGTYERMLSLFWGGPPTSVMVLECLVAAFGAALLLRRDRRLGAYLLLLTLVPPAIVSLLGAVWVSAGQNLARYVLPMQPLLLFFGSVGAMGIVRALARRRAETAAWASAGALSLAYLLATPTIRQVATLGTWYAHISYHWDYRYRWLVAEQGDRTYDPPAFYRKLGRLPAESITIIETPFNWEAPYDPLEYFATYHRQHELFGMIHGLCRDGPLVGEPPPRDRRFRFRLFVFLDDVDAVRNSGARYLVLDRGGPHQRPFPESGRCVDKLTRLYGAPIEDDARLAVFDLKPGAPPLLAR